MIINKKGSLQMKIILGKKKQVLTNKNKCAQMKINDCGKKTYGKISDK